MNRSRSPRIKCHSVRLESLRQISAKAFLARCFNGDEAVIPASQIFGEAGNDAWWISAWVLEKKNMQYSRKRTALFDTRTHKLVPFTTIKHRVPVAIEAQATQPDDGLVR